MNHYCQKRRKLVQHAGSKREILDGILYQLKNSCNWCDLPKDLPPYSTVFWHYKQWRASGVIEKIRDALHSQVRQQVKKKRFGTTLIIIDSQAVKNTCNASVKSKGFCFYKATNGIKRHLAVDSLGFPSCSVLTLRKPQSGRCAFFTRKKRELESHVYGRAWMKSEWRLQSPFKKLSCILILM